MADKKVCKLCGDVLLDFPIIHNIVECEKKELLRGRKEIKKLKLDIDLWKDAWYHNRDIIGWLWVHHPAIDNDEQRTYCQNLLTQIKETKSK